jgi:membrane protein implicated in regulation of membrane protease activity
VIALLEQITFWHWFAFGLCLLALELLGTAGYFLWLGLSALIVGFILLIGHVPWQIQWVAFSGLSLLTTWLWWKKQHDRDQQDEQHSQLNQKTKQLIGQTVRVEEDVSAGTFQLKIGDTTWPAQTDQPIQAGTLVTIVEVRGITLIVVI